MSLIEVLITFSLIGVLAALIVPRYILLQRNANIQTTQQQVDAVKQAILSWSAAQPSVSAVDTAYGNNTAISQATWTSIAGSYLDPAFAVRITPFVNGATISYFRTAEMLAITGTQRAGALYFDAAQTIQISQPDPVNGSNQYTAYGVIFWPTGAANRRSNQPTVVLYVPSP